MDNYENPKAGKTYISPSLDAFGQQDRKVRIASKVIASPDTYAFAKIKDEIVLRHHKDAKSYIKATFFEDDRQIFVLSIQGYTVATEKPHNASFSFVGEEIPKLLEFIANIKSVPFKANGAVDISDKELRKLALSNRQAHSLVEENQELFAEVIRSSLSKQDVVAVAYRKNQLDVFESLLHDRSYFDGLKTRKGCTDEGLWQQFFEKNPWIFGYGLNYVHLSRLDERKLEQIVQGYSVISHGKRVDALLQTRGAISSLCFVEIKTPDTPLLKNSPYRSGCWSISGGLSGAVSQVQGTVAAAAESIRSKLVVTDSDGAPTGEEAFNFSPKAYLVVGNLSQFVGEQGVNQDKFRSFELSRRNTLMPEIITFDELYERARFIVEANES